MALLGLKVEETERAQNRTTSGLTSSLTGLVLKILSIFKELKLNVFSYLAILLFLPLA